MILQAKVYKTMDDMDKQVFDKLQQMNEFSDKNDSENLAKVLVDSLNLHSNLK